MITIDMITSQLKTDNPELFTHDKGLIIFEGLPPDTTENAAGVYISYPINNRTLQVATIGGPAVYDDTVEFTVSLITAKASKDAKTARTAVEGLSTSALFKDYYAKPYATSDIYNPTNLEVDYAFSFNRTVVK